MRRSKINFIVLAIVVSVFLALPIYAVEVNDQEVNISVSQVFVSRYIWRGQDLYAQNDAAYQPSIDISAPGFLFGTDVGLNIWGSFPLSDGHEDGEELDYTLSFSKDFFDGLVSISEGYTYFDYPNTSDTADVSEPWVNITLNEIPKLPIPISMSVFMGYDFAAASGGPDEGWYYSWGFAGDIDLPEWEIFQEDQVVSCSITNWGNDGVADLKPSTLYATDFSFSTSYAFGDISVSPSLNYTMNHEEAINSGDSEIWTGIEISYVF